MRTTSPIFNITVNMIAPFMTDSALMTPHLREILTESDIPINNPIAVAKSAAFLCTQGWNGKTLMVVGDRFVELEEGIDKSRSVWLGETFSDVMTKAESVKYFDSQSGW
jgi:hypothetical protein